eukprot:CAMPEP_0115363776 /NCGR_PEP_ID=MMETSP0270-20121206/103417_1 /TAXON_ID=71861 /ORGANISM="Scrippsiella trochoidea, Strain CCMP3099" /LENGTH=162 /DNA_ID=CAMNT_0002786433 /DNA_START=780 /DNA_END=1268 /DNA_ORIENTATION=-
MLAITIAPRRTLQAIEHTEDCLPHHFSPAPRARGIALHQLLAALAASPVRSNVAGSALVWQRLNVRRTRVANSCRGPAGSAATATAVTAVEVEVVAVPVCVAAVAVVAPVVEVATVATVAGLDRPFVLPMPQSRGGVAVCPQESEHALPIADWRGPACRMAL